MHSRQLLTGSQRQVLWAITQQSLKQTQQKFQESQAQAQQEQQSRTSLLTCQLQEQQAQAHSVCSQQAQL